APGKEPDLHDPVILPLGSTVLDFAEQIHKDFAQKLKFARIWGPNKHGGQRVQRDYPLTDGDILELHI
ncbi:MAG: TGS domain-containing protein, partial [Thermodesulfobacteriota bacterium]